MHKKLLSACGLVALVTGVATLPPRPVGGAQLPQAQVQQTVTLRGVVVKAGTTEPIADVEIALANDAALRGRYLESLQTALEVARRNGTAPRPELLKELEGLRGGVPQGAMNLTATSGRDGRFTFSGLPPGQYTVRAYREGYFPETNDGSTPQIANVSVPLTTDQPSANVSIPLIPGAAIGGRVMDTEGRAVVNARVQVLRLNYDNGRPVLESSAGVVRSDDQGNFRVFHIRPGEYYVSVTPAIRGDSLGPATNRDLIPDPKEELVRTFFPDAIDARRAKTITLRSGEDFMGLTISVQKVRTIAVSGQVISGVTLSARTGRGDAIYPSAQLTLVPHDAEVLVDGSSMSTVFAAMGGENSGGFQLSNVLPGVYDLYARVPNTLPDGSAGDPPYFLGRTSFTAGSENLHGVSVLLHPPVDVKGYVRVDGNASAALDGARVSLRPSDSARLPAVSSSPRQIAVRADGTFTIPSVPEGDYRFWFLVPSIGDSSGGQRGVSPPRAYIEDIREGGLSVFDNGIHIGVEAPRLIEIVVKTDGGVVDGSVLDSKRQPKQGATVVLVPSPPRQQNFMLYKTATSDAMGRFVFRGVHPGPYKVFAWERVPFSAYQNAEFLARYENRGQFVSVTATATTSTTVVVIPLED